MAESEDRENTGSNQAGWRQLQAKLLKNHQVRESMASAGSGQLRRGWAALLGAGLLCRVQLQRTRLAMLHHDSGRARHVLAACRSEAERKQSACQRRVTASLHVVSQCFQSWSSRAIREALVRLHLPAIHQLLLKMGWQTWRRAYSVTRCLREAAELHAYLRTYAKHCHASASARAFTVWRGEAEPAARLQESRRFARRCGHRLALARWRGLVDGQAHARLQLDDATSHARRRWVYRWAKEANFQARRRRSQSMQLAVICALALRRLRAAAALHASRPFGRYLQSVIDRRAAVARWHDESATRVRLLRLVSAWGQRRLAVGLVGWVHCQSQRHTQQPLTCAPEALRAFLWRQVVASTSRGLVHLSLRCRDRQAAAWRAHLASMHHEQAQRDGVFNRWRRATVLPPDRHQPIIAAAATSALPFLASSPTCSSMLAKPAYSHRASQDF